VTDTQYVVTAAQYCDAHDVRLVYDEDKECFLCNVCEEVKAEYNGHKGKI